MTKATTTAGSDADRQAVLDVLARVDQAWEAGDAEAFVADYTEDASVIQPGVYQKDREEIRTNMAAAFAGPLSGSRVATHPVDVRFLTDDTAIVVSEDGIIFPGQDAVASEGLVRATWVLVRARRRLAHRLLPQQPRQLEAPSSRARGSAGAVQRPGSNGPWPQRWRHRDRQVNGVDLVRRMEGAVDDGAVCGLVLLRPGPSIGTQRRRWSSPPSTRSSPGGPPRPGSCAAAKLCTR